MVDSDFDRNVLINCPFDSNYEPILQAILFCLVVFVKQDEAKEAIYCIDEPELHVATGLQGLLIASILKLLPKSSQLWIATHSIGVVREAYRMQQERPGEVVFLDFSGRDFDGPVTIAPSTPNRMFWENTYKQTGDTCQRKHDR